jgi:hypothetical protein
MATSDPIYRVSVEYGMNMPDIGGGGVREVCAECCATTPMISVAGMPGVNFSWLANHRWRPPEPCKRCGRPVISDMRRKLPKHVVCGDKCRLAIYGAIGKARRRSRVRALICASCAAHFMPKRSDARFCSAACRQKAFRRRSRG